jgi:hypothetical protein
MAQSIGTRRPPRTPGYLRLWLEQAVAQGIEEVQADLAALPSPT